ncbi:MAG: hypothetical protein P9F19_02720 [Candidatus Contendobacter sp.]|nr:hypothetical protein [Candidatus Contendobacter sp.]
MKVRAWREEGVSFNAIAKRLFQEHGVTGTDGLPLAQNTVRGMAAA